MRDGKWEREGENEAMIERRNRTKWFSFPQSPLAIRCSSFAVSVQHSAQLRGLQSVSFFEKIEWSHEYSSSEWPADPWRLEPPFERHPVTCLTGILCWPCCSRIVSVRPFHLYVNCAPFTVTEDKWIVQNLGAWMWPSSMHLIIGKRWHKIRFDETSRFFAGGNCMTAMVATISFEFANIQESMSTCRFAQRVQCISNTIKWVLC